MLDAARCAGEILRVIASVRAWLFRQGLNLLPAYWGTGARVEYFSSDGREVRIALPLSWRTRNYVGTIFGGSMYAAVDPVYMVMLIRLLGPDYVVWDKSATIRFRRPGRSTLRARFLVPEAETDEIRAALEVQRSIDRTYRIELVDGEGTVCAEIEKVVYVRRRATAPAAAKRSAG